MFRRNLRKGLKVTVGTRIAPRHRVTGGSRPPPVPTEPDVQISSRGLFGS